MTIVEGATMAERKKSSFFILPTYNTPPPPNGPLDLGTTIVDMQDPVSSIISTSDVPITMKMKTIQRNFTRDTESQQGNKLFGLFGTKHKFTQLRIEQLESITFQPNSEYLEHIYEDPKLLEYFQSQKRYGGTSAYLITGLLIAKGMTLKETTSSKATKDSVDGSGPSNATDPSLGQGKQSSKIGSGLPGVPQDFVFAIQAQKIQYRRSKFPKPVSEKIPTEGRSSTVKGESKQRVGEEAEIIKLKLELARHREELRLLKEEKGEKKPIQSDQPNDEVIRVPISNGDANDIAQQEPIDYISPPLNSDADPAHPPSQHSYKPVTIPASISPPSPSPSPSPSPPLSPSIPPATPPPPPILQTGYVGGGDALPPRIFPPQNAPNRMSIASSSNTTTEEPAATNCLFCLHLSSTPETAAQLAARRERENRALLDEVLKDSMKQFLYDS